MGSAARRLGTSARHANSHPGYAHTAESAGRRAAHLTAPHEHLLISTRHVVVMLCNSSLTHVSISAFAATSI